MPNPLCLKPTTMTLSRNGLAVHEAPRNTPVRAKVDVLVAGGGPAGVGAALAAAAEGADTLLVERYGMLGGLWTAGLVNPFFEAMSNGWLVTALIDRLKAAGAWRTWKFSHTFDPEVMKRELELMTQEAGVTLLYHALCVDSIVEDGCLRGVLIESKAGREALLADIIVDCTGDGDVAARAGVPFEFGRLEDGLVQPMTLMFEVEGVGEYLQTSSGDLYDRMAEVLARQGLDYELPFGRVGYTPSIILLPAPGRAAVQLTHVYRLNPLDPADLTRGTVDARRQAHEAAEILRHVPGLESLRL
ncbi:MAG: FAD-dependent oxidoreductase, partial [Armatimonadota bacterium]